MAFISNKQDGYLTCFNSITNIKTSIKLDKKNNPKGLINVIITNCNKDFMRPVVDWYNESNHPDRLALIDELKNKKNKNKRLWLTRIASKNPGTTFLEKTTGLNFKTENLKLN